MHKIVTIAFGAVFLALLASCSQKDERLAESRSSKLEGIYDFFNDIRLDVHELEPQYSRLEDFTVETKKYLQSKTSQKLYNLAGLYFEKRLNREQGAIEYEDRFLADGMVFHVIVFPPSEEQTWKEALGYRKGKGRQVGVNFVFYQTFTAQAVDEELENTINAIVEKQIQKHAATLSKPI